MNDWDERFEVILRTRMSPERRSTPITPDLDLRQAGLDSLAVVDLLVALETEYGIDFPDSLLTADTFQTPRTLWSALASVRG